MRRLREKVKTNSMLETTVPLQKVPYLDLHAQHAPIKDEILAAVSGVIDRNAFVLGSEVENFERDFARFCDAHHCVGVNTGTAALHLALLAHNIGPGDEVITQTNTFIATVASILYSGATPVLVDIAPDSYTIDLSAVEQAITPRTKAILPVHLFGQPCDLSGVRELARKHRLSVIEDASQAHGATYADEMVGSKGTATFSFYPGKNLGACGEGGAVVTSDEQIAERVRVLRNHGSKEKYRHETLGYNYRLEGIQGAILQIKTRYLHRWTQARARVARRYDELLAEYERPLLLPGTTSAYHIYAILVENRENLRGALARAGIETNVHYPIPCHLQPGFASLGYREGQFPQSERLAKRELSLPIYPEMTDLQIQYVADRVREFAE